MTKSIRIRFVSFITILSLLLQVSACGYILHPERRNKNNGNKLDFAIVALDSIGLLFFIIPGIIAFAVDITSNTIYLPSNGKKFSSANNSENLAIKIDGELTKEKIAAALKENLGIDVNLEDSLIINDKKQRYAMLK